jgi:hypothetical protein
MTNVEWLTPGVLLPAVNPDDMKRVWRLVRQSTGAQGGRATSTMSIDVKLVAPQCSPGPDVLAVFFRMSILQRLLEQGMLNPWREGDGLRDIVFDNAATFAVRIGSDGFDPDAFLEQLRSSDP